MPKKPADAPAQPTLRLLDTLSVVSAPEKPDRQVRSNRVETPGLHEYVAMSRVNGEVGGDKGHMKDHPVKALILDRISETGIAQGHGRDLNYGGIEGETTASLQYRILNSDQKLSADKVERLIAAGVRYEKKILQPNALVIQYGDDDNVLEQIMQVLHKAGYDVQALFQRQHEVSYPIVDPVHTLNDIFDREKDIDAAERRELLEMVGYPMVMPQKFDGELPDAWEVTRRIVVPTEQEQAEDAKKAAEAAKLAAKAKPAARTVLAPARGSPAPVAAAPKSDLMATLKASLVIEKVVSGAPATPAPAARGRGGAFSLPAATTRSGSRARGGRPARH